MIKVNALVKSFFLVFISAFILMVTSSCEKKDEFNIEENNDVFFSDFKVEYNMLKFVDVDISLYYENDYSYYEVKALNEEGKNYHLLYIYRYGLYEYYFSIKDPEKNEKYFPSIYYDFLNAKESDLSKIYTKDEIEEFLKKYQIKYEV